MIYPNPNNGTFIIKLNYVTTKTTIEICDKNGTVIHHDKITSIEHAVKKGLAKGVYDLRILEDNRPVNSQELHIDHTVE
ncbi:MAG: T9SS type A sorting domain-containing protein [Bacteroidia bacterium]